MKIYKYPIGKLPGDYVISAPILYLLGIYLDPNNDPCLYAIVNNEALHNLTIHVCWTGWDLPEVAENWRHIATLEMEGLMCHYFEG